MVNLLALLLPAFAQDPAGDVAPMSLPAPRVEGTVLDASTGEPLPGVIVTARGATSVTGADGRFMLEVGPGAEVTLAREAFVSLTLPVPEDGELGVAPQPVGAPLEVVVEARRDEPVVSVQHLDRERVEETPGTFGDAVRLVQSLPGVALTQEFSPRAGALAIRAAEPTESRFLLDQIELPYLYHFNGYSSVLHTRLLDDLTLYPSTFGADWGDSVGGIVDSTSRWDQPDALRGSVNVNLIMAGAEMSAPVGERGVVRAGGRRSYLDAVSRNDEQYTVFPKFWDHFARAEWHPGAGRRWGLLWFGAGDSYTRTASEPEELTGWEDEANPSFTYDQRYQVVALVHRERVGRAVLDGVLAYVDYRVDGAVPEAFERSAERTLQLREEVVLAPSDALSVSTGVDARLRSTTLSALADRPWPELAREAPLVGRGVSLDEDVTRLLAGGWLEGRWEIGAVRVVPGLRVEGDTLSGAVVADPRALVRWEAGPDTKLRLAGGVYHQAPSVLQLSDEVGIEDLGPSRARQVALGVDHAIAGRWEVGVEGWGKLLDDVVVNLPDGSFSGPTTGEAVGVELTSRYRLRERFFASGALALGRATRDGIAFDYDQPWAANLVASWNFRPSWTAGLRYRASAGLPYTPVVDGLYEAATDTYAPVYGERNAARYPNYQKVDLRVEKAWKAWGTDLVAYAELWWVPAGANTMYQAYSFDYDAVAPVRGPSFLPLVGLRGER